MPRAVVQKGEATQGVIPPDPPMLYGYGRRGVLVQVLGREVDGRRFIRVARGIEANSTYNLPVDELRLPAVQPEIFEGDSMDDSSGPTCPHAITSIKHQLDYDEDLGLWVHNDPACQRPQAGHLRNVARADVQVFE